MFKSNKPTFFKGSSKGKKAFPGGLKGKPQPKYHKTHGKKLVQKKELMGIGKPTQLHPQSVAKPAQKQQYHLVSKPKQPKFYTDAQMTARIRRATSGK